MSSRLRLGCAVALLLLCCATPAAAGRNPPQLWMYNVHTKEEVRLEPYGWNDVLDWNAWATFNYFFRSWRTHQPYPVKLRLLEVLVRIQAVYPGQRIELISGYRAPGERNQSTSNHHVGAAADIRIPGVSNRDLFELCRSLPDVGCGLYPNGSHVHVDVRPRAAIWVDLSGYGDGAQYVARPAAWLERFPNAASEAQRAGTNDDAGGARARTHHARRRHRH